jgi:hypothetical protein
VLKDALFLLDPKNYILCEPASMQILGILKQAMTMYFIIYHLELPYYLMQTLIKLQNKVFRSVRVTSKT